MPNPASTLAGSYAIEDWVTVVGADITYHRKLETLGTALETFIGNSVAEWLAQAFKPETISAYKREIRV